MAIRDTDPATDDQPSRFRFDGYILDTARAALLRGGTEISLRPKTFAVLTYLVQNPGRLVSKSELFDAVWPNLAVTDDTLVQSVGELRRALGEDGSRLIRTIPRRGYRFDAAVSAIAPDQGMQEDTIVPSTPERSARPPVRFVSMNMVRRVSRASGLVMPALAALVVAAALGGAFGILWNADGSGNPPPPGRAVLAARPAIAVLPFANLSDDGGRDYFADGLTQDIVNALGRFSALTVMSWNAVLPFKGKEAKPADLGRRLAVRYLVEGSVRQDGDRVRVTAQLADTEHGQVLWSARFDDALADVFALQDKITTQIVSALAIRVTAIEQRRVFLKPTESLEAYDLVLRARPALQRPTRLNNVTARAQLRRAIELDPNYAAAHAALAETYYIATSMGWAQSPTAFLNQAEALAHKALALDDSEVRARVVLGRIHIFYQQYTQAEAQLERAIAINPNDANGLAGHGNILMWLGRADAAIEALERAQRVDPELNAIDRFALSLAYYLKGRYAAAVEQSELNLRNAPDANFSRVLLAAAHAQLGQMEQAKRELNAVRRLDPTFAPDGFGAKFLNPADLEQLREGLRKAGFDSA